MVTLRLEGLGVYWVEPSDTGSAVTVYSPGASALSVSPEVTDRL